MRLSTVILPIHRWSEGRKIWRRAEDLGFHAAYTYDHLSWRSFREKPWFGAVPTLTAAATATERLRLGTLVTSPNFRHPVTLAKELITLDDISGGRITLGIGAGGNGFDATALGQEAWTPRERAAHFADFVSLLDRLLTEDRVSARGTFYTAEEARNIPGCVQRPRLPFAVAATGPSGMGLAARHGQAWVTTGDPKLFETGTPEQSVEALRGQLDKLGKACADVGRDASGLDKILLTGFTPDRARPLGSLDAFVDFAGRHAELGFTELVIHWPVPDSDFATDLAVFETIATEGLAQLG
ncbi:LLM class flavin-dependent oxidoreductase [Streptomyces acidiscabies]|uniref:LLM class flavin-dependent oxidoreductase n=1 Tax=Streptomyces acidiscabies TaxID=42234 RepID=A0AAP6BCU9_9ACTN|nr:LLM class flavin-dependent oxidoreductase [Streptomyces acidiscabies]MBP5938429.1 LLM class flavin-dependent oxidoreductase [Streptomyces sp. LBUM 1476]MBZ3909529.1 LLM class flavin-dependent oxidoreductase [Streptomyces acidiscabies]MDX2962303.1 LLM class flavin-dependent oxidoreductase [Streptomyces acidiscabies]MDX3019755.1 LLM class flavin-dependent oxidoreductase [Streptomyces acidiscabies]MDX3792322.1 LLM class flavin-dependent oxidoreductase [Streptomyces acidiscabies]